MFRIYRCAEPEWPSGLQHRTCGMDGSGFEPQTSTNACVHICRYVDQKGLAAMLSSIQSAGVAPEVNLRNPPWLWNPGQISPEVQNRGISGPTKRTYVLQNLKKKKKNLWMYVSIMLFVVVSKTARSVWNTHPWVCIGPGLRSKFFQEVAMTAVLVPSVSAGSFSDRGRCERWY